MDAALWLVAACEDKGGKKKNSRMKMRWFVTQTALRIETEEGGQCCCILAAIMSLYDATMPFLSHPFQCPENVMLPFCHRKLRLAGGTALASVSLSLFLAFDRKLMILNVRLMHNE